LGKDLINPRSNYRFKWSLRRDTRLRLNA